jgi:hypothetical protein
MQDDDQREVPGPPPMTRKAATLTMVWLAVVVVAALWPFVAKLLARSAAT